MKQPQQKLVLSTESWRTRTKDQRAYPYKQILILIMAGCMPFSVQASVTCRGHFVNPITDICWSCLLPISIGGLSIGKGVMPKRRDTKNPTSPICACSKGGQPVPIPGISVGFWEPGRLVEVTRTPGCLVNLGGISIFEDNRKVTSSARGYARKSTQHSFYHLHYYVYPLIYWLELLTDFMCLEEGTFDVAYMSEFDITWNDPQHHVNMLVVVMASCTQMVAWSVPRLVVK